MSEGCEQPSPPATRDGRTGQAGFLTTTTIACATTAVFLFYTWFWVLCVGGTLGAGLALCLIKSRRVRLYCTALKFYLAHVPPQEEPDNTDERGCGACGARDCGRHDPRVSLEPWAGLRVHKQLDQAIENFYNAILENFVSGWYHKISRQPYFLDELRCQLRYASAMLLRRAKKINYPKFIMDKLIPCALHHHGIWTSAQRHLRRSKEMKLTAEHLRRAGAGPGLSEVEVAALNGPLRGSLHPAVASRAGELKYLRCVTAAIMPYLLRKEEVDNKVFQVLIREIFAGWVLLSLTDVLADPYVLNTLVVLATGDDTMSPLPTWPDYQVELLESFARPTDGQRTRRARLLRVDLDTLLTSPEYLYALMQFMKGIGQLHLLQFCKDMKPFQMKILNPELTKNEEVSLFNEAWDLYVQYFDPDSPSAIPFQPSIVEEMRSVLSEGAANVKKLQTSKALYQSSKFADSLLENAYIPKFLHSEEFYKVFLGPRTPTGYQKHMPKKSEEKLAASVSRIGKIKSVRSSTIDGQILDSYTSTMDMSEAGVTDHDAVENMNILRYLDSLAEHTKLEEHDLSNWRVHFTNVELRQESKRGLIGSTRVFTVYVERAGVGGPGCDPERLSAWSVTRSEHDLHLLRAKLIEFHGEALLQELTLPSRRDNSPLETLRYKYEDFVQRLLRLPLLTTSQLLHIFLTARTDFGMAVQRASLGASGSDLSNIYQSVAHRLRKEKGQHLESFMSAFLLSSDMERYQAMKQGSALLVEEAEEAESVTSADCQSECQSADDCQSEHGRNICSRTFGNNFNTACPRLVRTECVYQDKLTGFTQCFIYFLSLTRARRVVRGAAVAAGAALRSVLDRAALRHLAAILNKLLSQRRLAHLVRLGHDLMWNQKGRTRVRSEREQYERAREQLLSRTPPALCLLLGAQFPLGLEQVLAMLQHARLNKQLVYNLLDLCVAELFPEIVDQDLNSKTR